MRRFSRFFFFFLSLTPCLFPPVLFAEIIQLKNGNAVETKILKESEEFVIVEAPGGKVKIPKSDIQTIWRGTKEQLMVVRGKEVYFAKGVELYKEGKFREAAESFENSLGLSAMSALIYANLGSTYASLGAAQKAEANFLKAFQADPNNATNLLNLARYYESVKRFPKAITYYQKLITLKPEDNDLKRSLAYCQFNAGDYPAAATAFEELGRKNDMVSQCNAAAAYIQAGELDKAEALLKALLESHSPVPKAYLNMATLCRLRKDYDLAEQYYRQGLKRDPKNDALHLGLGQMYFEKKNLEQAKASFEQVLDKNPRNSAALFGLAKVFAEKKNTAQAMEYSEKLIKQSPRDLRTLNGVGLLYLQMNEPKLALKIFKRATGIRDAYAPGHANAGLAYAVMNDADNALKEWSRALELDPKLAAAVQNKKLLEDAMRGSGNEKNSQS